MRHLALFLSAAFGVLAAPPVTIAQDTGLKYKGTTLKVDGTIEQVLFLDLTGDALKDIVLQKNKDLLIFKQRANRTFPDRPDETLRLQDNTFLWFACALSEKQPTAVVAMTSSGLSLYSYRDGKLQTQPEELLTFPNLFEARSNSPPLFMDFLPDLNMDGRRDLTLFQKGELMIFYQNAEGRFRVHQKLKVPMEADRSEAIVSTRKISDNISVPPLFIGDVNGDGKKDVAFYYREGVGLYLQEPDGKFREKQYSLVEKKSKRKSTLLTFEIAPIMEDINHDGILDIILPFPSKGSLNIYYTRAGRTDFRLPDDVKKTDGWLVGTWLKDVDHDNKHDLIVAGIEKFGIIGGLQIFLTQKIPLQLIMYPYRNDGFVKEPASRLTFHIPFIISLTSDNVSVNTTFLPNFDGDFNKDGLNDLLVKGDDNTLKIYFGRRDTVFEDTPSAQIKFTPPAETAITDIYVAELNGDGRADVVLRHSYWKEERQFHTVELLLSE